MQKIALNNILSHLKNHFKYLLWCNKLFPTLSLKSFPLIIFYEMCGPRKQALLDWAIILSFAALT